MKVNDPLDTPTEQWRPGVETRMLVSARNGATQLCLFEQWVAPGNGAPTHSHADGACWRSGNVARSGEGDCAGQSLIVPARRLHGFRNSGTVRLHLHAVLASSVFEAMPEGATEAVRRWT